MWWRCRRSDGKGGKRKSGNSRSRAGGGTAVSALALFAFRFRLQHLIGGEGGGGFCVFLALAGAAREFHASVMHGAFEDAVVVGASGGSHLVLRRFGGDGLQ